MSQFDNAQPLRPRVGSSQSRGAEGSFASASRTAAEQPLALQAGAFGALSSEAGAAAPNEQFGEEAQKLSESFVDLNQLKDGKLPGEDDPQFTLKAVLAGAFAGSFGCLLAIYYGLKTGITPSLNIISSLIAYVVLKSVLRCCSSVTTFTVQENVVAQTVAVCCLTCGSSTGFSSGLLGMSKQAAIITNDIPGSNLDDSLVLNWPRTFSFCIALCFFGLFLAFPLRDYCIMQRKLPFPSGTATGSVIQTMHADGDTAIANFKVLAKWTGGATIWRLFTWCFDGLSDFPLFGLKARDMGFVIDWDPGTFAIGALLSPTINLSILLGGIVGQAILVPWLNANHLCQSGNNASHADDQGGKCWFWSAAEDGSGASPHYLDGAAYTLFPAIAMIVVDGFYSIFKLALLLLTPKKASDVADADHENTSPEQRRKNEIFYSANLPWTMFLGGYLLAATVCVFLVALVFKVKFWQTIIAMCLTPIFAIGIIVGVGMTDWDVSSSFGKLMMIPFGMMNRGESLIPSLAVCMITICGCGAAAAAMQDYKTAYLVGTHPVNMFKGQICGAFVGCFVAPTMFQGFNSAFTIPTDDPTAFLSGKFGFIYRTLAAVCTSEGLSALPKNCTTFMLIFAIITLVLNLAQDFLGKVNPKIPKFLPSAMATSIGLMLGPQVGLEFTATGLALEVWKYSDPKRADQLGVIMASGCLAGSGIAVLIQIAFSLCGINPPISVTFGPGA